MSQATVTTRSSNGFAYTALVLGVLAALLVWVPMAGFVLGLPAIAVSWVALSREQSRVPAIIGLIGGVFGLLSNVAILLVLA